jgi:hypothetical protein
MLRELARKNLKLGAIQIGQLSAKQMRIDEERRQAMADMVAGWLGEKPAGASKQAPDPVATFAYVA